MTSHMYTFVSPKHPCPTCNKVVMKTIKLADVHEPCTPRIGPLFKCVDCALMFPEKEKLADHRWKTHLKKPFTCTKCRAQFIKMSNAVKHYFTNHQLECHSVGCGLHFDTKEQLREHVKSVHLGAGSTGVELRYVPSTANANSSLLLPAPSRVPAPGPQVAPIPAAGGTTGPLPFTPIMPEEKGMQAGDLQILLDLLKHCDVCDGYFISDTQLNAHESLHQKSLPPSKSQIKPQKAVAPLIPDPPAANLNAGAATVSLEANGRSCPPATPILRIAPVGAPTQRPERVTASPSPLRVLAAAGAPVHISVPDFMPTAVLPFVPIISPGHSSSSAPAKAPSAPGTNSPENAAQMLSFPGAQVTKMPGSSHFIVALKTSPEDRIPISRILKIVNDQVPQNAVSQQPVARCVSDIVAKTGASAKVAAANRTAGQKNGGAELVMNNVSDSTSNPSSSQLSEPEIIVLNDDPMNDNFWN